MENCWRIFHIKILQKNPFAAFSILYNQDENTENSKFVLSEDVSLEIWKKSKSPLWMDKTIELQKTNTDLARDYVLYKLEKAKNDAYIKSPFSFGWSGSLDSDPDIKDDNFVGKVIDLLSSDQERE